MEVEIVYLKITSKDILCLISQFYEEFYLQELITMYTKIHKKFLKEYRKLEDIKTEYNRIISMNITSVFRSNSSLLMNIMDTSRAIFYNSSLMDPRRTELYDIYENISYEYDMLQYDLNIPVSKTEYRDIKYMNGVQTLRRYIGIDQMRNIICDVLIKIYIIKLMREKLIDVSNSKLNIYKSLLTHLYQKTHNWKFVCRELIGFTSLYESELRALLDMNYNSLQHFLSMKFQ